MKTKGAGLFVAFIVLMGPAHNASPAADFETPPTLKAADFLDPSLLKGEHYEIDPRVVNDGFMNRFTIRSDFGTFEANSQAMVPVRVQEVRALEELKELSQTDVFTDALVASAKKPIDAAMRIADDPVGTVKAIPEGVGRLFKKTALGVERAAKKVGEVAAGSEEDKSTSEAAGEAAEKAWETGKDFVGYSSAKRALARRVGADPYSTNRVLQEELDRLAWAAFVGEVGIKQTVGKVPLQGEIASVSDMVWDLSPADLEVMNRDRLKKMGASKETVDSYYRNGWHTPTVKTAIVELVSGLEGAEGRMKILDLAAAVKSLDESLLFLSSLKILKDYHTGVAPVRKITSGNLLPWGVTEKGIVIPAAVDHLVWTEPVAETAAAVGAHPSATGVELRIAGTASDRVRREIESRGWALTERALPPVTPR